MTTSICTNEVQELDDRNVMFSQTNDTFERKTTLLAKCQTTYPNEFDTFCLYAPASGKLSNMCAGPTAFNETFLFDRMIEKTLTSLKDLPQVIAYPTFSVQREWVEPVPAGPIIYPPLVPRTMDKLAVSQDAVIQVGISLGSVYCNDHSDHLFRKEPGGAFGNPNNRIISDAENEFTSVAVSAPGSIRAVMFLEAGFFIWTTASQKFIPIRTEVGDEDERPFIKHLSLVMYQTPEIVGDNVGVALTYQTQLFIYVDLYEISPSDANIDAIQPYKRIRIGQRPTNEFKTENPLVEPYIEPNSPLLWSVLVPDVPEICIGYLYSEFPNQFTIRILMLSTQKDTNVTFTAFSNVVCPMDTNTRLQSVRTLQKWNVRIQNNLGWIFWCFLEPQFAIYEIYLQYQNIPQGQIGYIGPNTPYRPFVRMNLTSAEMNDNGGLLINRSIVQGSSNQLQHNENQYALAITPDERFVCVKLGNGFMWVLDVASRNFVRQIPLYILDGIRLDEETNGYYNQWFIGTSIATASTNPPLTFAPSTDIEDRLFMRSKHSLFKLIVQGLILGLNVPFFTVRAANIPFMITKTMPSGMKRETRLYDSGNIRIVDINIVTNADSLVWESATNDQEGSDVIFTVLDLVVTYTAENLPAVSSKNGRYILVIQQDGSVELLFNPFNSPRFTAWTKTQSKLPQAVDAQADFCARVLNNAAKNQLKFVDDRCACLPSDRLLNRVYPENANVSSGTRASMLNNLPCVMGDCLVTDTSEFTNASAYVGNRCVSSVAICSEFAPPEVSNILVSQDCDIALRPCTTSSECPLGANCVKGYCQTSCSNDITCQNANPLARCINGQCQIQMSPPVTAAESTKRTIFFVLAVILAVALLVLFLLIIFYATKRQSSSANV